jgi:hypothetical protein
MAFRQIVFAAGIAIALPGHGGAQAPGPTGNAPAPRTPLNAVDRTAAIEHLDSARGLLAGIEDASLAGDGATRVAKLRLHFSELGALYHASDTPQSANTVQSANSRADAPLEPRPKSNEVQTVVTRPGDWRGKFAEVERDLSGLIGGGPASGAPGTPAATTDKPTAETGLKDLNPAVRKVLQQFRHELELFYAASLTETGGAAIPK